MMEEEIATNSMTLVFTSSSVSYSLIVMMILISGMPITRPTYI
jgi:hypothetical protein